MRAGAALVPPAHRRSVGRQHMTSTTSEPWLDFTSLSIPDIYRAACSVVYCAACGVVYRAACGLVYRAARAARRDACQTFYFYVLVLVLISAWNNVNNKKDFEQ